MKITHQFAIAGILMFLLLIFVASNVPEENPPAGATTQTVGKPSITDNENKTLKLTLSTTDENGNKKNKECVEYEFNPSQKTAVEKTSGIVDKINTCKKKMYKAEQLRDDNGLTNRFVVWKTGSQKQVTVTVDSDPSGQFCSVNKNGSQFLGVENNLSAWDSLWLVDPIFQVRGVATGICGDSSTASSIRLGTSLYFVDLNTFPGESSDQILQELKFHLESGGIQNVKIVSLDSLGGSGYGISFKVNTAVDTSVLYGSHDTGIDYSFFMRNSWGTLFPPAEIDGPVHITLHEQNILYNCTNFFGGFWDIANYVNGGLSFAVDTNRAHIKWQNDTAVCINAGHIPGHFVIYYNTGGYGTLGDEIEDTCCSKTYGSKHGYVDDPQPVQIASLSFNVSKNNLNLSWTTSSESNNSGFEVQRMSLESPWTAIAFIPGAGNSTEPRSYTYEDKNLASGIYHYRLKQIDYNGNFEYFELPEAVTIGVPDKFFVDQNYPNPFNPLTTIAYGIPQAGNVVLKIFDMAGREVKALVNENKDAGYYVAKFDGSSLASGTYIYRIESGSFVSAKKMLLLK